ncbi:MAG: hypothetical protein HYR56_26670 [Acidobacteria bacterium]|nr:hypothetical protein [Acidobacteriota bacterium]MBI3424617.1 hypothetical protein [Acidobacteriota bacterium]
MLLRRIVLPASFFCLLALLGGARLALAQTTTLRFADLPETFHDWLKEQGLLPNAFDQWIAKQNRETAERELRGEYEHLIYFALQSTRFTKLPKIEPALSAREFARSLSEAERSAWLAESSAPLPPCARIPKAAQQRLQEFLKTLRGFTDDERLLYLRQLTSADKRPLNELTARLCQAYAETMRFLYQKEFRVETEELAKLYQTRGHSTDTQIEANFAVQQSLAILKSQQPKLKLNRVLIVGPGLDFAPRTDLLDLFGPQSYQPFAVADALLSLGLADEKQLRVHCVDINERVIAHLQRVSKASARQLSLLSGLADKPALPLTDDYKHYFQTLGDAIGTSAPLAVPPEFAGHLHKRLTLRPELLAKFSAARLNVITERYEPTRQFDLIVVTNVFPYFNDIELLSGLTNLAKMLAHGGCLVHNEPRVTAPAVTQALGLPVLHSRTFLIAAPGAGERSAPLYDFAGIHQKTNQ